MVEEFVPSTAQSAPPPSAYLDQSNYSAEEQGQNGAGQGMPKPSRRVPKPPRNKPWQRTVSKENLFNSMHSTLGELRQHRFFNGKSSNTQTRPPPPPRISNGHQLEECAVEPNGDTFEEMSADPPPPPPAAAVVDVEQKHEDRPKKPPPLSVSFNNGDPYGTIDPLDVDRPVGHSIDMNEKRYSTSLSGSTAVSGKWIECRECESGRTLWYYSTTMEVSFLSPYRLSMSSESRNSNKSSNTPTHQRESRTLSIRGTPSPSNPVSFDDNFEDDLKNVPIRSPKPLKRNPYKPTQPPCEELLDLANHGWNYTNDVCQTYRAQSARIHHHKYHPEPVHLAFPAYFSAAPLPSLANGTFMCTVRLPPGASKAMSSTKVQCKQLSTCGSAVIDRALKKIPNHYPLNQYILKVVGCEEYIFGDILITDYEYIRNCLRNGLEINLSLIHEPHREEQIKEAAIRQLQELEEIKEAYPEDVRESDFLQYEDVSLDGCNSGTWEEMDFFSLRELKWPYRIKVLSVEGSENFPRMQHHDMHSIYVKTALYIGAEMIQHTERETPKCKLDFDPTWGDWLQDASGAHVRFSDLPHVSRLVCLVYGISDNDGDICLGWVNVNLIDHRNRLLSGRYALPMWFLSDPKKPGKEDDMWFVIRGTTRPNVVSEKQVIINLEFDSFLLHVISTTEPPSIQIDEDEVGPETPLKSFSKEQRKMLENIKNNNPLDTMSADMKALIWEARHNFTHMPWALPVFLRSVDWADAQQGAEARRLLKEWTPPSEPHSSLELLDYRFADPTVRQYAIDILDDMHDSDLQEFLLQLTQCLKYEHSHMSPLGKFLIRRALKNPYQIGHFFFWHLKAEMHEAHYCERYGLLLEEYLLHCGSHGIDLCNQDFIIKRLLVVAEDIARSKRLEGVKSLELKAKLRKQLTELNAELPEKFSITLNPRWKAKSLIVEECKFMSSKKVPLWLVFENCDEHADPILVMFKSGDDLRQDLLTLQLLRVMDKIWLSQGLDMRLKPYTCVATGVNDQEEGVGYIEIVCNSHTINNIHMKFGGDKLGALRLSPLEDYLREHNKGPIFKMALDNFMRSCAGYCVATFALGIGDRHSDNIMITKLGHLFHIDFGHFLGNFKTKAGFNRERSPFVFTREMAYVMGGEKSSHYKKFVSHCCQAYNILRKHNRILIVLFILMVSAGMPELAREEDIHYLRDLLHIDHTEKQAANKFKKEIKGSIRDKYRLLDNTIHMWKHG